MPDYTFSITGQDLSGSEWQKFIDNVKKANEQVATLGKSPAMDSLASGITGIKSRIEGLVGVAKGFVGAFTGLWVVDQVREYGAAAERTAIQIAGLAQQTGLTTGQVQALQTMSRVTGQSFSDLATYAKDNAAWLAKVSEEARRLGTTMDEGPIKQAEVLAEKATISQQKLEAMVAGPWVSGKWWLTERLENLIDNLDVIGSHPGLMKIAELLRLVDPTRSTGPQFRMESLDRAIEESQSNINALKRQFENRLTPQQIEVYTRTLEREEQTLGQLLARKGKSLGPSPESPFVSPQDALQRLKPLTVTAPPAAGGGGDRRDRIGENLQQFTAQAEAAKTALEALQKVGRQSTLPLDDLERGIKLEKDIADAEAAARKYAKDDPRIPQLREQITLRETYDSSYQKFIGSLKLADATERQYGNGQAVRLQTESQLKDARDTGRLSVEAYNLAVQELGKSTEDLRLKNIGLQGGFAGFIAGWENAQNQFVRANNEFAMGGKVFDGLMSTMDSGLNELVNKGQVNLQRLVGSFFLSLAQMEMRAATSSLWSAAGKGISGGGGGIIGSILGAFGIGGGGANAGGFATLGSGAGITNGVPNFSGMASGGDIGAGDTHLVGEEGPELFRPKSAGTIIPNDKLGGGGAQVIINQNMSVGDLVTPTQLFQAMSTTRKAAQDGAMAALIAMGRRGDSRVRGVFA